MRERGRGVVDVRGMNDVVVDESNVSQVSYFTLLPSMGLPVAHPVLMNRH